MSTVVITATGSLETGRRHDLPRVWKESRSLVNRRTRYFEVTAGSYKILPSNRHVRERNGR